MILVVILAVLTGAAVAAVYGMSTLAQHGIRDSAPGVRLRAGAALAAATTCAMYLWGAAQLVLDETMTDMACKKAAPEGQAVYVSGTDISYLPLRLNCHVPYGDSYGAAVPDYVNPALLVLALLTVLLGVCAAVESELRARAESSSGDSNPA
ncbi:hypothetical protein HUT18_15970 [Streptomyces sp. NA04227]|uniref:hypothetical protein n=1 Tax=Streptomyces sp. NA04227 TaxID=2742136 RepID=UPI001591D2CA|nr:hypothetical protein [Streptomyces sp. NA04227]QKW07653.1 hypothetical protein HUT18_15970 [Streptomyces sp. NA04227]